MKIQRTGIVPISNYLNRQIHGLSVRPVRGIGGCHFYSCSLILAVAPRAVVWLSSSRGSGK